MNRTYENRSIARDLYYSDPLLSCEQLAYIGLYCIFLIIMAIGCNSFVIYNFYKEKALLKPINLMLLSYCVLCLSAALVEVPMVTYTSFKCRYTYGKLGCEFGGFWMYFCGCSSVYLLMAVSIERLIVIYKPVIAQKINISKTALTICMCCFFGLLWALFPFFGWSYYSLEGVNISCSVEWRDQSWNVVSYNITICIFVFIIPFSVLLFTSLKFLYLLRKFRNKISDKISTQTIQFRMQKEKRMTIHLILLVICFCVTWTPYGVLCLYCAFFNHAYLDPVISSFPPLFAKSFLFFPALLNIIFDRFYKETSIQNTSLRPTIQK